MSQDNPTNTFSAPLFHHRHDIPALVQDFLASATLSPEEKEQEEEALRLVRALDTEERQEKRQDLFASLRALADKGSQTASFGVAIQLYRGDLTDADPVRGQTILRDLCDRGFVPAFAELVQHLSPKDLPKPGHDDVIALALRGCELNVAACLLFFGAYRKTCMFELPGLDVARLLAQLLDLARTGCWEALEVLVECYQVHAPDILPDDIRDAALALLEQACEAGWSEAMVLCAMLHREGILLPNDHDLARQWDEQACALGNLDGCTAVAMDLFAEAMEGNDPATNFARAREVLARGCEKKHPRSLVLMSELVRFESVCLPTRRKKRKNASTEEEIERQRQQLLSEAADLGMPEPYVNALWNDLLGRDPQDAASCDRAAFARDELVRLAAAGHDYARYKLGLFRSRFAGRDNFAELAAEGVQGDVYDNGMELLGACALFGPTYATLAETALFSPRFDPDNTELRDFLQQGLGLHNVRCIVLHALLLLDIGGLHSNIAALAVRDVSARLKWATFKGDLLARMISLCLATGVGFRQQREERSLVEKQVPGQTQGMSLEQYHASQLYNAIREARARKEIAPLLYLARQFQRGRSSRSTQEVAGFLLRRLDVQMEGPAIDVLSSVLVALANNYGANHTGEFAPMNETRQRTRPTNRRKEKARQARKAAQKARKRR